MTALDTAVRRLRKIAGDAISDRDLLHRYTSRRDADAFGELVKRHGPAVWGVCRRILANPHDAEDAFQNTFITLARKAGSVRHADALGCWLHGVAVRTALRAKRKQRPSAELTDLPATERDEPTWRDVRRVLDEELARLPERWRLPVVLCHLDGLTRDEAAKLLGWTLGTLRGRLEDGRNRLRDRLARRGVELSAALLAVAAATEATALPHPLRDATLAAVQSLSPGLVMGKLHAMMLFAVVAGLGATAFTFRGDGAEPPKGKSPDAPAKAELPADIAKLFASADRVWVVENAKPVEVLKGMTTPASVELKVDAIAKLPKEGRRIVFLKSIDEVDQLPKIEAIAGDTWHLPADEAAVASLRAHLPACEWGTPVFGLRLGILARPDGEPTVEIVLQNVGDKTLTTNQFRGISRDDWPQLKLDVTRPDGTTHRIERHAKPSKDGAVPNARELKPGERHIQVVRLNRWLTPPAGGNTMNAPAGLFAAAADYRVRATYLHSDPRSGERGIIAVSLSGTAKITVPEPGLFGERVGDLRIRLQQPKGPIKSGDFPKLVCDLENLGDEKRSVFTMPENASIELDGVWHHNVRDAAFGGKTHEVGKGTFREWLAFTPSEHWVRVEKVDRMGMGGTDQVTFPFHLLAGRHTLRVAYPVAKDVRLVSNAVTIEVDALSAEITDIARKADCIWVVNSPTPDKPVPERVGVLKGPAGPATGHFDLRQLPGSDPKAKYIVFLTSEEDRVAAAKVTPWRRAGDWYIPHSTEAEAAIRKLMTENVAWGEERGGLRLGLRIDPESIAKGKPLSAEVVLQNVGKADATVEQLRLNIYDYWPNTSFEVTMGEHGWTLAKPSDAMDEADKLRTMTLKPGECYVHSVRLTEWQRTFVSSAVRHPRPFVEPGEHTVTAKVAGLTSAAAKVSVKAK